MDLQRGDKHIVLSDLSVTTHGRMQKKAVWKQQFNLSGIAWDEEFKTPDGSYSISGIQDYFEYII